MFCLLSSFWYVMMLGEGYLWFIASKAIKIYAHWICIALAWYRRALCHAPWITPWGEWKLWERASWFEGNQSIVEKVGRMTLRSSYWRVRWQRRSVTLLEIVLREARPGFGKESGQVCLGKARSNDSKVLTRLHKLWNWSHYNSRTKIILSSQDSVLLGWISYPDYSGWVYRPLLRYWGGQTLFRRTKYIERKNMA